MLKTLSFCRFGAFVYGALVRTQGVAIPEDCGVENYPIILRLKIPFEVNNNTNYLLPTYSSEISIYRKIFSFF